MRQQGAYSPDYTSGPSPSYSPGYGSGSDAGSPQYSPTSGAGSDDGAVFSEEEEEEQPQVRILCTGPSCTRDHLAVAALSNGFPQA